MLVKSKIKADVKQAFLVEMESTDNRYDVLDRVADKLADVIIESIKSAKINYTTGLIAPMGAVTGEFNCEIE